MHGFVEEGTTTTPFDMVVLNKTDRFRLALAAVERIPILAEFREPFRRFVDAKIAMHRQQITLHGIDLPEIEQWDWSAKTGQDALWAAVEKPGDPFLRTTNYSEDDQ